VAEPRTGLVAYFKHRHDPLTSLVLTVPVFLLYHLGILFIQLRNGVDLVTELTLELLERSVLAYVGVTLVIAAGLFAAGWLLRKKGKIKPAQLPPVLLESTVLAVIMMFTVGWATHQLLPGQTGGEPMGPLEKIVMAAGAGFHEELVFRVGLFAGGAWLLARRMSKTRAVLIALVISSVVFSAVHYIGPLADDFALGSFLFRVLAGAFLAAVYHFRGFAVAVYTHALYDVMVFFFV
jgi:membrane protease YdiL (CAAX protease family)